MKIKSENLLAIVVILVSIGIGLTPLAIQKTSFDTANVNFNASVNVVKPVKVNNTHVGVNADPTMHFGNMPVNTNLTKWVQVSVDRRSEVDIETTGNISRLLSYRSPRIIEGNSRIPIRVRSKELGYHDGKVTVTVLRPNNRWGRMYLDVKTRLSKLF